MQNRFWRIARRPEGHDFASALALEDAPLAPLATGEIRISNSHLSMDAGTRLWLTDREDGYQPPLPVGAPMTGLVLGEVVDMSVRDDCLDPGGRYVDASVYHPIARLHADNYIVADRQFELKRPADADLWETILPAGKAD